MKVQVSQLIPGCVLTEDVMGKTSLPIMEKNTVITEEHLVILQKFLVEEVEVSRTLVDGKVFKTGAMEEELTNERIINKNKEEKTTFHTQYEHAIINYKDQFRQWQNNIPINIAEIRKSLLPLINYAMDADIKIFRLNRHIIRQDFLYHHSVIVSLLSAFLAKKMGYEKGESIQIGLAGFLSDIGMAKINPQLINKDSPLTTEEQDEIEKHPSYSYLLLQDVQMIKETVKLAVLQHHERFDGSGYPLGLTESKIHQYARIVAVCDTYQRLTSEDFGKKGLSPFKAMNELQKDQYTKLDSQVVQTFIQSFINISLGVRVKLSNNKIGKITYIDNKSLHSPLILLEENKEIISLEDGIDIIDFI